MIRLVEFFNTLVTSGGGHEEKESIFNVVMHHMTDHVINTGFIGKINEQYFSEKLFGIFDMRITKWVLMLWTAFFLVCLVFIPLAQAIKRSPMGSESKWVNMWEAIIGFVHDEIVEPNFEHEHVKKAMPYFCSVFFFVLFCNYIGLIPGMSTATGNLAVTGGLAMFTLIGILLIGIIMHGPLFLITGLVPGGVPVFLFPLLWVIEVMGLLIKPFALTVRLFANMTAGHIVIIIFIGCP